MTTTTLRAGNVAATHAVTNAFSNAVTSIPGAASAPGCLRNLSVNAMIVVKGGAVAPDNNSSGELLPAHGEVYCDTPFIWVRTIVGEGFVAYETI
jgi:hypothetical protein